MTRLDADNLPHRLYADRVSDRLVAELLGLCRGIIADGVVNDLEVIAIAAWLHSHPDAAAGFPGRELAARIEHIIKGDHIDDSERHELEAMLLDLVGDTAKLEGNLNQSSRLPLDKPEPPLVFAEREFVFTGHFALRRKECSEKVLERGGIVANAVRRSTHYLVIGHVAADAWVQSAWGTKILDASDARARGQAIAIVSEAHWLAAVGHE
jgi:NAD-dependent DNA ligase